MNINQNESNVVQKLLSEEQNNDFIEKMDNAIKNDSTKDLNNIYRKNIRRLI